MQAAFLVLARKPDAVRAPGTVGGFLRGAGVFGLAVSQR